MEQLREVAINSLFAGIKTRGKIDHVSLKNRVREDISKFLYSKTKRRPMVLPVIMYI